MYKLTKFDMSILKTSAILKNLILSSILNNNAIYDNAVIYYDGTGDYIIKIATNNREC